MSSHVKSVGIADMHTHILPCLDDGSRSPEQSLDMLGAIYSQGVCDVVATPHFYARTEEPEAFLRRREASVGLLLEKLESDGDLGGTGESLRLYLGAEVEFFNAMSLSASLDEMCIGNTKYLLVEMPFERWTAAMAQELFLMIKERDIVPILAHIERYFAFFTPEMLDALIGEGVLVQSNAEAFLRMRTRRRAMKLLSEGKIHFLGSDCHDTCRRAPNISAALERIKAVLGSGVADQLCENSGAVLSLATALWESKK